MIGVPYLLGAALGFSLASGVGAWWAVSSADSRIEKITQERDDARRDLAAQSSSLRVLTEAGMAARSESTTALEEARRGTARDKATIARLRADIAAGAALSCTDAASKVRQELQP